MASSIVSPIQVQTNTNFPDTAWSDIKDSINKTKVEQIPLDTPIFSDKVNIFN